MVIKRRAPAVRKRKKRRKNEPNRFSVKGGIKVYRSGIEGGAWNLVDSDPTVRQAGDTISISANIAVDKAAKKQSAVTFDISEDALIALIETQFGIKNMSIGSLIAEIKMLREST